MADMGVLKWKVQNGDLTDLKEIVEKEKCDLSADVGMGQTLLHCAADYGQLEVIEYLLSKKLNINSEDQHGITPLLNAIFEGHTECVKLLLKKGAVYKNKKTPSGESYMEAAEKDEIKDLLK